MYQANNKINKKKKKKKKKKVLFWTRRRFWPFGYKKNQGLPGIQLPPPEEKLKARY
jgi:hypothetical protein